MTFQRFCVPMNEKFRIWGVEVEAISDKEWIVYLNEPFYFKGKNCVGINEKVLREARYHGAERLIADIKGQTKVIEIPNLNMLEKMEKEGDFEDHKSKFQGSKPMRIYYFQL